LLTPPGLSAPVSPYFISTVSRNLPRRDREPPGSDPVLDLLRPLVDDRERMGCGQSKPLPVGKLPLEHLRSLLRHPSKHDPRLLIGPQIGEDAAVIDAGDRYLVVATDPVTFATDHIGRYAVHVNANDVAVSLWEKCYVGQLSRRRCLDPRQL